MTVPATNFVEARKRYDWPSRKLELTPHPRGFAYRCYMVAGSACSAHDVSRFRTWLQRQLDQLRAAEAQGERVVASYEFPILRGGNPNRQMNLNLVI
jgi:hypothetical protein